MQKIVKKTMTAVIVVLVSAVSLAAHHSLSQFDTTTAITVKGIIVRIELVNPHSILYLDQKETNGQTQHWAVEGPGVVQLTRSGFNKESLKAGDVVVACGYIMKDATVSTAKIASGKLMDAEMLLMPDGQKQKWSDYGQHLCLGPDYHDFHK